MNTLSGLAMKEWWKEWEAYRDVSAEQFLNTRWQLRNTIRSVDELKGVCPLPESFLQKADEVTNLVPLRITPYYLSLCSLFECPPFESPIGLQCLPNPNELDDPTRELDPLDEDAHMPLPGIIHRYPNRALLLVNNNLCSVFCRYCTRKRLLSQPDSAAIKNFEEIVRYLHDHGEINDVILSGGDPLMVSTRILDKIVETLESIEHIRVIRIASRVPVTLPVRLAERSVQDFFSRHPSLWLITHFNHPVEVNPVSRSALEMTARKGVPLMNQTVLLKNVNDSSEIMRDLFERLISCKVKPYYLFLCEPTRGNSHLETTRQVGLEIMSYLRKKTSGLAIPLFVEDVAGEDYKIPVT